MSTNDNLHGYRSLRVRRLFSQSEEDQAENYDHEAIDDEIETMIAHDIDKISKRFTSTVGQPTNFKSLKEKIEYSVENIITLENADATEELLNYVDELNGEYKDTLNRYYNEYDIEPKIDIRDEEIYSNDDVDLYNEDFETSEQAFFETLDADDLEESMESNEITNEQFSIDHIIKKSEKQIFNNGNHKELLHDLIKDVSNENNQTSYDHNRFHENIESIMNGLYEEQNVERNLQITDNSNISINNKDEEIKELIQQNNQATDQDTNVESLDGKEKLTNKESVTTFVEEPNNHHTSSNSIQGEQRAHLDEKKIKEDVKHQTKTDELYYETNLISTLIRGLMTIIKFSIIIGLVLSILFISFVIVYRVNPDIYPDWVDDFINFARPFYQSVKDSMKPIVDQIGDLLPSKIKDFLRPTYHKIREIF